MAIQDTWFKRDGTPTSLHGEGRRWRLRYHGQSKSMDDITRKKSGPSASDEAPQEVVIAWLAMRTAAAKTPSSEVTVGKLLDRWLLTKRRLSKSGYDNCRFAADRVRGEFGDVLASDLTRPAVREWVAGVDGGASKVRKTFQALRGALQIAVDEGGLQRNPADGADLPPERPRTAQYKTWGQVEKLARAATVIRSVRPDGSFEGIDYGPMVWLMAVTGLRIGEVCALNVGDVNKKTGVLQVRAEDVGASKSDPRWVVLPAHVLAMLDLSRTKKAPLFTSPTGVRLSERNWRKRVFYPAVELAWLDGMHPHDLRHTAVSLAVQAGAHEKVVQRMVGHKRPIMTGRYSHLYEADLADVAARMNEMVPSS